MLFLHHDIEGRKGEDVRQGRRQDILLLQLKVREELEDEERGQERRVDEGLQEVQGKDLNAREGC